MSLKKRLFTSSGAAGSDGYTDNLTSWVQVGTGKSWEGSGTSMTDLSSNTNNFTLQGGYSYSSGNNYVSLTANSGNMVSSVNLPKNTNYSVLIWYNLSMSSSYSFLLGGNNTSYINYITLGNVTSARSNESIGTYTDYGGTDFDYAPLNGHYAYADGTWRMFVLTNAASSDLRFYMNGGSTHISSLTNSFWSTSSLSVGRYSSGIVHNGLAIGQIRAYSVVLTVQQVIDTYNATKGLYGL
jgi:hypothetical protein